MRIGIICPYSLTPGGVQMQVLGLARIAQAGERVRVLARAMAALARRHPLGNSLPTAANGSIARWLPTPRPVAGDSGHAR